MKKPQTLREVLLIARDRHDGASGRRLAEIAQAAGYDVDRTQINDILRGTYRHHPKRPLLDAVAYLADQSRETVYGIAREPLPLGDFRSEIPDEADVLTASQRQAVLGVVKEFISTERARNEVRSSQPSQRPSSKPSS